MIKGKIFFSFIFGDDYGSVSDTEEGFSKYITLPKILSFPSKVRDYFLKKACSDISGIVQLNKTQTHYQAHIWILSYLFPSQPPPTV